MNYTKWVLKFTKILVLTPLVLNANNYIAVIDGGFFLDDLQTSNLILIDGMVNKVNFKTHGTEIVKIISEYIDTNPSNKIFIIPMSITKNKNNILYHLDFIYNQKKQYLEHKGGININFINLCYGIIDSNILTDSICWYFSEFEKMDIYTFAALSNYKISKYSHDYPTDCNSQNIFKVKNGNSLNNKEAHFIVKFKNNNLNNELLDDNSLATAHTTGIMIKEIKKISKNKKFTKLIYHD
jgi:hypothetical protein